MTRIYRALRRHLGIVLTEHDPAEIEKGLRRLVLCLCGLSKYGWHVAGPREMQ